MLCSRPDGAQALISWQQQDFSSTRETLNHVITMDPLYQPAYTLLANLEFKDAKSFDNTLAFELIEKVRGRDGRRTRRKEDIVVVKASLRLSD